MIFHILRNLSRRCPFTTRWLMNRGVPIWVQIILPAEVPATAPVLWEADSKEEGKVPKVHPDWMGLSGECCCSDFAQKNPIKTDRTHDQLYKK